MATASVSIDRTSLTLSPLVLNGSGGGTYTLTPRGLGAVVTAWRYGWMPSHPDVHGDELLSATLENARLSLEVLVEAATSVALETAVTALNEALFQFSYEVTQTVDGVAKTWTCFPSVAVPVAGVVLHNEVAEHFGVFSMSIPVYPIAS